ncbi:MAG TPA: hypothetical protein VN033_12145 [Vulgatibacter sp.]|nr:hypothetical protein [Vulgatibacter sp.]
MRGKTIILALALAGAAACEGGTEETTTTLETPPWMLTIVTPAHGAQVDDRMEVELALTGRGVALDLPRAFQVGYFLDDALVLASPDLKVTLEVPVGAHVLRVAGVDEAGAPTSAVAGDRIQVIRLDSGP